MHRSPETQKELTGRHVLIAFLAFFGVIFLVNGVFLTRAIWSYTGLVANEPYRKGLNYNERITAGDAQRALGWTHTTTLANDGRLRIIFQDRSNQTVSGLKLAATVGRPSTTAGEVAIALQEVRPGEYAGDTGRLPAGRWLIAAEASKTNRKGVDEIVYRLKERAWLKP